MTRSSRIESILSLAGLDAREAARALAQALRELKVKESEVARLKAYLDEYRQRAGTVGQSVPSGRWQNDRLFMTRLSEVIVAQEAVLAEARVRHRKQVESWRRSHRYNRALQQLFETYCRAELAALERSEQDEADELVLRSLGRD